jgi:hypothetical protein
MDETVEKVKIDQTISNEKLETFSLAYLGKA